MKKYLKLILILGAAFIVSDFSIKNVFLAQSPRINPFFAQNMMAKVNRFWAKTGSFIASLNPFSKLSFQPSENLSNQESSISKTDFNAPVQPTRASSEIAVVDTPTQSKKVLEVLKSVPLHKISQGVYAGEKNNIKVYEIRIDEIEYLEYTFNVKGKEIKIKVPKGQAPPSQEVVERVFQ